MKQHCTESERGTMQNVLGFLVAGANKWSRSDRRKRQPENDIATAIAQQTATTRAAEDGWIRGFRDEAHQSGRIGEREKERKKVTSEQITRYWLAGWLASG